MASVAVPTHLTPEEYLAFEHKATTKHENNSCCRYKNLI